jgi:invasion protein IalB
MPLLLGASMAVAGLVILGGVAFFTGVLPLPQSATALAVADVADAAASSPPSAPQRAAPVPAAAQPAAAPTAQMTSQQNYGDWLYGCVQAADGSVGGCSILQRLVDTKSKAGLFLWRIVQDSKGGLVALWQTPEGVRLSRGLTLDAGTPKPITVPYEGCGSGRCQAVANLDPGFVAVLAKSEKISVDFTLANGQQVRLNVSPSGLAAGLAALQEKPAAATH